MTGQENAHPKTKKEPADLGQALKDESDNPHGGEHNSAGSTSFEKLLRNTEISKIECANQGLQGQDRVKGQLRARSTAGRLVTNKSATGSLKCTVEWSPPLVERPCCPKTDPIGRGEQPEQRSVLGDTSLIGGDRETRTTSEGDQQ